MKAAAKVVAKNLMSYYHGNEPGQTPGILPGPPDDNKGPYYWWEGGALWGTMIDYWFYTKDTNYNNDTEKAIVWQAARRRTASCRRTGLRHWGTTTKAFGA